VRRPRRSAGDGSSGEPGRLSDAECVALLQWALPLLRLRWQGFRRVRRQVCRRIARRIEALGLDGAVAYRERVASDAAERAVLDGLCRIAISRFYRDRTVFDRLRDEVLPELAVRAGLGDEQELRCWSAGCASGEEPYTLSVLFRLSVQPRFPGLDLRLVATYAASTLRELPAPWRREAFALRGGEWCLRPEFREGVELRRQDIREHMPEGPFELVLCRNLAFTYFDELLQREVLAKLARRLMPGGFLVIGGRESLPGPAPAFEAAGGRPPIFRRTTLTETLDWRGKARAAAVAVSASGH
jgi:chemotaxis protein methyltransferase CheR